MPPSGKRRRATSITSGLGFNASLFKPDDLVTADGLQKACTHVLDIISEKEAAKAMHVILRGLCEEPFLLEFFYPKNNEISHFIRDQLMANYPSTARQFLDSHYVALLRRIAGFYDLYESHTGSFRLSCARDSIQKTVDGLELLDRLDLHVLDDLQHTLEENSAMFSNVKRSQGSIKREKKAKFRQEEVQVILNQFKELDLVEPPCNSQEVKTIIEHLLSSQRVVITDYFASLHRQDMRMFCVDIFTNSMSQSNTVDKAVLKETINERLPSNSDQQEDFLPRPIKASLLFESAARFGPWKIAISSAAYEHLRKHNKGGHIRIILKKIKELSDGHFSADNMKPITSAKEEEVPVYEAKLTRDLRLVYTIEMYPVDGDPKSEIQGILVWGLYNHDGIKRRIWLKISKLLGGRGKEYRKRCLARYRPDSTQNHLPAQFPTPSPSGELSPKDDDLSREEALELHELYVLQKRFPLSDPLIDSIINGRAESHIFGASADEIKIIQQPSSCYIIGRSGTGKTTAMLFKMLAVEVNFNDNPDFYFRRPRQLFVTQSSVLAARVADFYQSLSTWYKGGGNRDNDPSTATLGINKAQGKISIYPDVNPDGLPEGLPGKFLELEDVHFPLFLSFDQICKLLENQYNLNPNRARAPETPSTTSFTDTFGIYQTGEERASINVTYDVFRKSYWPHFPDKHKKHLDPYLVFSEIIGVIKGSEAALTSPTNIMEEEDYLNLGTRRSSVLDNQRTSVYCLFRVYQKLKSKCGDYDAADRTTMLLKCMADKLPIDSRVDYLFVDEVQDQTIVDIQLLRKLSRNRNGMCWAGDTAQTIAAGSAFKFNELKAALYRIECSESIGAKSQVEAPVFQLTRNYRSHASIVDCASDIVELIIKFWPESIDRLEKEQGVVAGSRLRPVFFRYREDAGPLYMHFISGGQKMEFGAGQCILVRNVSARNKLREAVGDIGIILTIYECKGLEFDDVLLYDFFNDSVPSFAEWRVVLNAIDERLTGSAPVPNFVETRHRSVITELKNLYVGITRARKQVWILDSSDRGEPIRMYWMSRSSIDSISSPEDLPPLAVASSPEEWEERGSQFLSNKKFIQAKFCFQKANAELLLAISEAYILREDAIDQSRDSSKYVRDSAKNTYLRAATAFSDLPNPQKWAVLAAECFAHANQHTRAGECYLLVSKFKDAAHCFWLGGAFESLLHILQFNRAALSPEDNERYTERLSLYYSRLDDYQKVMMLFENNNEKIKDFLEERGLEKQKARFQLFENKPVEAADTFIQEGDYIHAIDALIGTREPRHMEKAKRMLIEEIWSRFPMQYAITTPNDIQGDELLARLPFLESEIDPMRHFQLFVSPNINTTFTITDAHNFLKKGQAAVAIRLFDVIFDNPSFWARDRAISEIEEHMTLLDAYTSTLQVSPFQDTSLDSSIYELLFGFRPSQTELPFQEQMNFVLLANSPLKKYIEHIYLSSEGADAKENDALVSKADLATLIKRFTNNRLSNVIGSQEAGFRNQTALRTCINTVLYGACKRIECPCGHFELSELLSGIYQTQVYCHLKQLVLMRPIVPSLAWKERYELERFWFTQLCDTLFPFVGTRYGDPSFLPPDLSVGSKAHLLRSWIKYIIFTLHPTTFDGRPRVYFLLNLTRAILLAFTLNYSEARRYVFYAPCCRAVSFPSKDLFLGSNIIHDLFVFAASTDFTCLIRGARFITLVINQQLIVDLNVLVWLIEEFCAKFLMRTTLDRRNSFHGLTIPRSWFSLYYHKIGNPGSVLPGGLKHGLVNAIGHLIYSLHSGTQLAHLRLSNTNLQMPNVSHIRAIFVQRLCRCIGLIGYASSIHHEEPRRTILSITRRLRMPPPHALYKRYAYADHWMGLAWAVRCSLQDQTSDEMLLFSYARSPTLTVPAGLTLIHYGEEDNIYAIVESRGYTKKKPGSQDSVANMRNDVHIEQENIERIAENELAQVNEALDEPDLLYEEEKETEEYVNVENLEDPSVQVTDAEIKAAECIQRALRTYLADTDKRNKRRKLLKKNTLFLEYLQIVNAACDKGWSRDYTSVLIWRLPNLYHCITKFYEVVFATKVKWKKRFSDTSSTHTELDEVGPKLTHAVKLLKTVQQLKKKIAPDGLTPSGFLSDLTEIVEEVSQLLEKSRSLLTKAEFETIAGSLSATKRPLGQWFAVKKPDKPILNIDVEDLTLH